VRLTAPDYLLGVACDAARQAKTGSKPSMPIRPAVAGGDHSRCFFR
jgi:hypothetical protein